jgi:hypothetical protein
MMPILTVGRDICWCQWSVVSRQLVFGLWSLVFGLWSLVFGLWSLKLYLVNHTSELKPIQH